MATPTLETVECDILIIGGGMSGCGAAFESKFWGSDLRVVIAEKAVIERSGATGEGLSASTATWDSVTAGTRLKTSSTTWSTT